MHHHSNEYEQKKEKLERPIFLGWKEYKLKQGTKF